MSPLPAHICRHPCRLEGVSNAPSTISTMVDNNADKHAWRKNKTTATDHTMRTIFRCRHQRMRLRTPIHGHNFTRVRLEGKDAALVHQIPHGHVTVGIGREHMSHRIEQTMAAGGDGSSADQRIRLGTLRGGWGARCIGRGGAGNSHSLVQRRVQFLCVCVCVCVCV